MWRTEVDEARAGVDSAYGREALANHTDGSYLRASPFFAAQLFHALEADASGGGVTTLVDGAAVAQQLAERAPAALRWLSRNALHFAHRDAAADVRAARPPLLLDARGRFRAISFNDADRVAVAGAGASPRAYAALRALLAATRDPLLELRVALRPGTALLFDNARVLHGRSAIGGARRVLAGAYVSDDDWRSRLRLLHAAAAAAAATQRSAPAGAPA